MRKRLWISSKLTLMPKESLVQLLETRRRLARRLSELDAMRRPYTDQMEQVEREIFQRLRVMASAMEGDASPDASSATTKDSPLVYPSRERFLNWATTLGIDTSESPREPSGRLLDHAEETLRERGPMTRNELFDHLVAKGVTIPGKDPRANLSAHLSNSDKIRRDDQGRWTVVQIELDDKKATKQEGDEKETPA